MARHTGFGEILFKGAEGGGFVLHLLERQFTGGGTLGSLAPEFRELGFDQRDLADSLCELRSLCSVNRICGGGFQRTGFVCIAGGFDRAIGLAQAPEWLKDILLNAGVKGLKCSGFGLPRQRGLERLKFLAYLGRTLLETRILLELPQGLLNGAHVSSATGTRLFSGAFWSRLLRACHRGFDLGQLGRQRDFLTDSALGLGSSFTSYTGRFLCCLTARLGAVALFVPQGINRFPNLSVLDILGSKFFAQVLRKRSARRQLGNGLGQGFKLCPRDLLLALEKLFTPGASHTLRRKGSFLAVGFLCRTQCAKLLADYLNILGLGLQRVSGLVGGGRDLLLLNALIGRSTQRLQDLIAQLFRLRNLVLRLSLA